MQSHGPHQDYRRHMGDRLRIRRTGKAVGGEYVYPRHEQREKGRGGRNKIEYSCPECGVNVWGRPGLKVICGECSKERDDARKNSGPQIGRKGWHEMRIEFTPYVVCGDDKQEAVYEFLNNMCPEDMEYFNQRIDECREVRKRLDQDSKDFPMGTVITYREMALFAWFPNDKNEDDKPRSIMIFDYDELIDISERNREGSDPAVFLDD